jgi:mannose-6-phosphate isomerase-like protein (cupin superfamily)
MLIRLTDRPEIREEGYPLVMKTAINRAEHSQDISITWVRIWGHHKRMVCDLSDRPYYIIEGEGTFQVGEGEPFAVVGGDLVYIPRGVPYEFSGQMAYLVMNGPAFVPGSDQVIEERRLPEP